MQYTGATAQSRFGGDYEKALPHKKAGVPEDDEDDEDIDALIEDLQSQDGGMDFDEEEEVAAGAARNVPEELLMTDPRHGLSSTEVLARRKKYGLNQMKGK